MATTVNVTVELQLVARIEALTDRVAQLESRLRSGGFGSSHGEYERSRSQRDDLLYVIPDEEIGPPTEDANNGCFTLDSSLATPQELVDGQQYVVADTWCKQNASRAQERIYNPCLGVTIPADEPVLVHREYRTGKWLVMPCGGEGVSAELTCATFGALPAADRDGTKTQILAVGPDGCRWITVALCQFNVGPAQPL